MSLSSFSSIFEVLAGLLIIFTGLDVATQSLTKKVNEITLKIGSSLATIIAEIALLNKTNKEYNIKGVVAIGESCESLKAYYLRLYGIGYKKMKTNNGYTTMGELVLKKKFIPVFLYATFYTFYTLILCGISNNDNTFIVKDVVVGSQDIGFITLSIFSVYSFVVLNILLFRSYRMPYKPYHSNFIVTFWRKLNRWASLYKIFIWCSTGFIISLSTVFFTSITIENIYYQLFIVLFSIFITLYPFISLFIWLNIGFATKKRYIENWYDDLSACITDAQNLEIDIKTRKRLDNIQKRSVGVGLLRIFISENYKSILLVIATIIVLFLMLGNILRPDKEAIEKLLTKETNLEYSSYKKLPKIDTLWFDSVFTEKGNARKKIRTAILNHRDKNETIAGNSNPSNHTINEDEMKIIGWINGRLKVQTSEYWYLRWFDSNTQKPISGYFSPNFFPQFFYLVKDEKGNWKIDDIEYFGVTFN